MWLVTSNRKGIPSTQLSREISVTQKTVWYMLQRIRKAMGYTDKDIDLSGEVEVDEAYIGGREKNKHFSKRIKGTQGISFKTKEAVLEMLERGGKVVVVHLNNTKHNTITNEVIKRVKFGSVLSSDEFHAYSRLGTLYQHISVNHSVGEYVNKMAHTNGIESFWALLKRGYVGIYHHISTKHLRYVTECSTRFNLQYLQTEGERTTRVLSNTSCRKLSYKELVA